MSESLGVNPSDTLGSQPYTPTFGQHTQKKPLVTGDDIDLSLAEEQYRFRIREMLRKYESMWDGSFEEISTVNHRIELHPGTRPIAQHAYRAGAKVREAEQAEVHRMLEADIVEPAQSEWASPVVLFPKPDGSLRFCVDYRKLNAATVKDTYPLPRMGDVIDSRGDTNLFTTLDCKSGYWKIPIAPPDTDKPAFVFLSGLFRVPRMPLGLSNAPATFQRTVYILRSPFKWKSCIFYLHKVLISSKEIESHFDQVAQVRTLHAASITLNFGKCDFFTPEVKYLGRIVRPGSLSVDLARVAPIQEAEQPRTPCSLAIQAQPTIEQCRSTAQYHSKWMSWLDSLMSTAKSSMSKEQDRYRRNFNQCLRRDNQDIRSGSFVFVRKDYTNKNERKHKLAPIANGPYRVVNDDEHTVLIEDGSRRERISRDRVEAAPNPEVVLHRAVLGNASVLLPQVTGTPIVLGDLANSPGEKNSIANGIRSRGLPPAANLCASVRTRSSESINEPPLR